MRAHLLVILLATTLLKQLSFAPTSNLSYLTNDSCPDIPQIDAEMRAYMQKNGFVGAQIAVMRHDSLLYAKGYGWADRDKGQQMQPNMTMRIASVSKLVTAVGIMKLVEEGMLSLDSKIFSADGILADDPLAKEVRDPLAKRITVEHLLRHKGGFSARRGDPMFTTGVTDGRMAVTRALHQKLAFMPGGSQEYSNVGYFILSLVIEKVTGEDYERWMLENILCPMQCYNFHIAGNYLAQRKPNEVHYYMHQGGEFKPDYHGNGKIVEGCYGANNINGTKGAGAWATTAAELCRMVAGIDYDMGIRAILDRESVDLMTEYFDRETFSLGWNDTNQEGVWTRTGSFGGTTAMIKYFTATGDCWVILTNTSTYMGPHIASRTSALINRLREKSLDKLPSKDLFYK